MNGFNSNLLDGKTKLHFVGIGGSGMFPLVQILHAVGYEITGSDVGVGDIVDREKAMGIPVYHGHRAENVHGAQLVVYTAAIMKGNPEIEEARRLGIPTVERSVMLGYVTNTYPCPICISGTHGKTTTTAMTVQIMVMAGLDPAAVIGGKLPLIDGYGRYGAGRNIVVEACEYHNTFLQLVPHTSVILNIDADHLEFFKTMDNLKEAFHKFALLTEHRVIANIDDANTVAVMGRVDRDVRTFGIRQQGRLPRRERAGIPPVVLRIRRGRARRTGRACAPFGTRLPQRLQRAGRLCLRRGRGLHARPVRPGACGLPRRGAPV